MYVCVCVCVCVYIYVGRVYLGIMLWWRAEYIQVTESRRTHRFSVTLSFAPKHSSDRTLFNEEHTSLYTN